MECILWPHFGQATVTMCACVCTHLSSYHTFTFSNGCSYEENVRDAHFYRHVIVFTPFAVTALGLASICLLVLYQYCKRREMLQVVAMSDQARANIQISELNMVQEAINKFIAKFNDI